MVGGLEPADPRLIGPYQLLGRLGAGGMGRVFLGVSAAGRPVAVKIVHAELAAHGDHRRKPAIKILGKFVRAINKNGTGIYHSSFWLRLLSGFFD